MGVCYLPEGRREGGIFLDTQIWSFRILSFLELKKTTNWNFLIWPFTENKLSGISRWWSFSFLLFYFAYNTYMALSAI